MPQCIFSPFKSILELSVDAYLEKFDLVRNNAITACSSGESLQGKVGKVLNHMTQLGTMSNDLSKGIRSEINDKIQFFQSNH